MCISSIDHTTVTDTTSGRISLEATALKSRSTGHTWIVFWPTALPTPYAPDPAPSALTRSFWPRPRTSELHFPYLPTSETKYTYTTTSSRPFPAPLLLQDIRGQSPSPWTRLFLTDHLTEDCSGRIARIGTVVQ